MRYGILGLAAALWAHSGHGLSMNERFRIAEQAMREAMRGDAEWERVLAIYRYLEQNAENQDQRERARLGMAEAYLASGDPVACVTMLEDVIQLNGHRRDWALFRKGMILMYKAAHTPSSAQARSIRNRAVESYRQLADEHPESNYAPQSLFFVANNMLVHQRSTRRAARVYQELIDRHPDSEEAALASRLLPRIDRLSDAQLRELSR